MSKGNTNLKIQNIVGMLIPTVPDAADEKTCRNIYAALDTAELHGMISYWPSGHLELSQTAYVEGDRNSAPLKFVERLKVMTQQPGVKELRLSGEIVLTESGDEPVLVRIRFNEGAVSYQEALCSWKSPVTS